MSEVGKAKRRKDADRSRALRRDLLKARFLFWLAAIPMALLAVSFVGFTVWGLISRDGESSPHATGSGVFTMAGFMRLVDEEADCQSLFDYRNSLRQQDPSKAELLNTELRRLGCSSSSSTRSDLQGLEMGRVEAPEQACERAWAAYVGNEADAQMDWAIMVVDGDRRLFWRLDDVLSEIRLCDVETTGSFQNPDSVKVYSTFFMSPVGVPPNEILPTEEAMLLMADSLR